MVLIWVLPTWLWMNWWLKYQQGRQVVVSWVNRAIEPGEILATDFSKDHTHINVPVQAFSMHGAHLSRIGARYRENYSSGSRPQSLKLF